VNLEGMNHGKWYTGEKDRTSVCVRGGDPLAIKELAQIIS
jgi:hypothetical protein